MSRFLAIIPARGGSKRLPNKNVLSLGDKPLVTWTIEAALNSKYIDELLVSSDDQRILSIAGKYGATCVERPTELASDTSTTVGVVQHAIRTLPKKYEYVVLLQPTSPLRTTDHINEAINLLLRRNADAVISVCEVEHSPLWSNTLPSDRNMENFLHYENIQRSQDLTKYYRLNGAVYICRTDKFLREKTFFLRKNIFAYIMKAKDSVDIDTKIDMLLARCLVENGSLSQ